MQKHAVMASSSQQVHRSHNPLEEVISGELGKDEGGGDWLGLDLGLGLRFDSTTGCKKPAHEQSHPVSSTALASSSSSSPFLIHHQQRHDQQQIQSGLGIGIRLGLGLGLGLEPRASVGFDQKGVRSMNGEPPSNNHNKLCQVLDQDHEIPLRSRQMKLTNHLLHWQMPGFITDSNDYRRPHPGFWFTLISSTNRFGEALPQVPKAYIRVKDEHMTISTVKKYLVTKLGLSNEAEVDISCMGLNLQHTLTLRQVRDVVWLPRLIQSVNSTTVLFQNSEDMSMPLHYERRCLFDLNN